MAENGRANIETTRNDDFLINVSRWQASILQLYVYFNPRLQGDMKTELNHGYASYYQSPIWRGRVNGVAAFQSS